MALNKKWNVSNKLDKNLNVKNNEKGIRITDHIKVRFKQCYKQESFEIVIQNNSQDEFVLRSIETSEDTVHLCGIQTEQITIKPNDRVKLHFQADFVANKCEAMVKIQFIIIMRKNAFIITRTVRVKYQPKVAIRQSTYDIPSDLFNLFDCRHKKSYSQLLDSLDKRVDKKYSEDEYSDHFHNLLYLEEIGLSIEMKEKYSKISGYFNDRFSEKQTVYGECVQISQKYDDCVYDLAVEDLFETRPSLQVGKASIIQTQIITFKSYAKMIIA